MQILGFVLIGIGLVCLVGLMVWGAIQVLNLIFGGIPIIVTVVVGCIGAGVLVLIGKVIKDRVKQGKKEDFKEVEK